MQIVRTFASENAKTDFSYNEMRLVPTFSLLCGLQIGHVVNGERDQFAFENGWNTALLNIEYA